MARSSRLALAAAVALAFPAFLACNTLIGLDDFEKTDACTGAGCADGGKPDVVQADVAIDTKPDAPKGADPVSWARWRMPNYSDAGPDASPLPNPPSLDTTTESDHVTDTVTGLSWRSTLLSGDFTADKAASACAALTGTSPYRLPKRIELVTLLDYGREPAAQPRIHPAFAGFAPVTVWTSSEVRPFVGGPTQAYWTVDFETGKVRPLDGNVPARVLCVRAK
jgi:Protein of unknown function (DUF1566)